MEETMGKKTYSPEAWKARTRITLTVHAWKKLSKKNKTCVLSDGKWYEICVEKVNRKAVSTLARKIKALQDKLTKMQEMA
jgi:hypothetical protein